MPLIVTFGGVGGQHIFGAEGHKISSGCPAPGLFSTLKIVWGLYAGFTLLGIGLLQFEGMSGFDAVCHSFTALSTGGFSTYGASVAHYETAGYANFRWIQYTLTGLMMLGGSTSWCTTAC